MKKTELLKLRKNICVSIFGVLVFCQFSMAQLNQEAITAFTIHKMSISASLTKYDTCHSNAVINRLEIPLHDQNTAVTFGDSKWNIKTDIQANSEHSGRYDVSLTFTCIYGNSPASSVSLNLDFTNWSTKNYVLMPSAVYNGNRVKSKRHPYCPFWFDANDVGIDKPQLVSDVPRLNIDTGFSRIQQRTGDMSTPSIGFHDPSKKQGFWLLTTQETRL